MDKLGPTLAECQNKEFKPWSELPCKGGPCFEDVGLYSFDCKSELKKVFVNDDEECECDLTKISQKGLKIGDEIKISGSKNINNGTVVDPNVSNESCICKAFWYKDNTGNGKWLRKESFENEILGFLISLTIINQANEKSFISPVINVPSHYEKVSQWLERGISDNFSAIDFSTRIGTEVQEALKQMGFYGDGIEPSNIVFDILSFGSPKAFATLSKLLLNTVKDTGVVLVKGGKKAVVSVMLRAGERKAVAELTERGVLQELKFLKGSEILGKVEKFSVKNSKFVNELGEEGTGNLRYLVDDAGEGGWAVVQGAGDLTNYLKLKGYSLFDEIDDVVFFKDASNRVGKIIDKTKPDNITWFTPKTGKTWPIHEINTTDYLKFKYGNKVSTQVKIRTYHKNGETVDGYLDDLVETNSGDILIIDAKHSQKAQIVDGKIPGYTTGQTKSYQWITEGDAVKIEIIGNNVQNDIPSLIKGDDILPQLKGKIGIITNDANGHMVELSVYKTKK